MATATVLLAAAPAQAADDMSFSFSKLAGESASDPTSVQFGPDGRLYVLERDGDIKAFNVVRDTANQYRVTATESLTQVKSLPNHNDTGASDGVGGRLATGMVVAGTASQPVLYVTSSDPREGAGLENGKGDVGLDTNSGILSKLTKSGSSWSHVQLVRGLPRSEENHVSNGLALNPATNTIYIAVGGNTNKGAPSTGFALLPEYALSSAILSVNLGAIGSSTYDLPTLDDPARPGSVDANDPFGGNDGNNQAMLVPGGPVQVFAPGFRNPYDVVLTKAGQLWTVDNGGNAGWGGAPIGEGPGGTCSNGVNDSGDSDKDTLHRVTPGYYGGHPVPVRGNKGNTFAGQSPLLGAADPRQCDYIDPETFALASFGSSTNGLVEYTASNFGPGVKGDLITVGTQLHHLYHVKVAAAATSVQGVATIVSDTAHGGGNSGGFGTYPLDVTAQGDAGPFPGTVWVGDFGTGNILVYEPTVCTGTGTDRDADGYSDADEAANGTNACSAADVPSDFDADKVSDRSDGDDDNDGRPDVSDAFQVDPRNGTATKVGVRYGFDSGGNDPGILNLGFTGLLVNGKSDYLDLFDPAELTARGAAGLFTVDLPRGDASGSRNDLRNGFQFGVDAADGDAPFTVRGRLTKPLATVSPQAGDSVGVYIGTGDQDNFAKVAVTGAEGGSIEVVRESGGSGTRIAASKFDLAASASVDVAFVVDPGSRRARAFYAVNGAAAAGSVRPLGDAFAVPEAWLRTTSTGMAVGIMATAGRPMAATWDFVEAQRGGSLGSGVAPVNPGQSERPSLTRVKLSPSRFRAARRGGMFGARPGSSSRLTFRLSEAARVRWSVEQARSGRVSNRRCVKPARSNRGGRRCVYYVALRGASTRTARPGSNSLRFRARVNGKALRPGNYRLAGKATDAAGNRSKTERVAFRVVRR